ncbi:hypothetical protein D8B26_001430 [Coccidioides posadasii str. Silveira]|uniref:Uncharacterized protein n=1 Tax=Coccidioides posadasii (strain RMSCC 757 / Silveira) TaxID=443226 RepID=E9DAF0_COCPS|nr:hypothetical protein CPSG_06531 [Coccidioides posadasii str. Silveira]QVM06723.1 hypothetical protein D8B26_001430 [Coccidioides posadasii str. Silveira]
MATPEERLPWLSAASIIDEKLHGPRPDTPICERKCDPQFIKKLEFCLDGLLFIQTLRRRNYGDDAEEWPPSHTPVKLKGRWEAEQEAEARRIQSVLEIPTPEYEPPGAPPMITKKRSLDDIPSSRCSNPPSSVTLP